MLDFEDILYEKNEGIAKITINRPKVLNAFRTHTLKEMALALEDADLDNSVGVVVLTGAGDKAFCVGGDNKEVKEGVGYHPEMDHWHTQVHHAIRSIGKPVIAAINGWCIGGGNVLQVVCDLSIAADTATFGQLGPKVGSFDAGFGAGFLARVVGERKAREIWFLCRQYSAIEALEMGLINKVVPLKKLEEEVTTWCKEILRLSPTALKFLKISFNADTDAMFGLEAMAMASVRLYWGTEEAKKWKTNFWEKKSSDKEK